MPKKIPVAPPLKKSKPTEPEKIPRVIALPTIDDHLAVMSRAIFQAGLSWAFIESRWATFVREFDGFSVDRIIDYGDYDLERLMTADGIVHSRAKIAGTIANARELFGLANEYTSIEEYVRSFPTYREFHANAKKRFAFLGDLNAYYWLFRTGLPVPPFERWMEGQERDHPRMREMVMLARSEGRSPEIAEVSFIPAAGESAGVSESSPIVR